MPIEDFDGETFVAFVDISGFKELMSTGRAFDALDRFYRTGYFALLQQDNGVGERTDGLFISDCGILFVRPNGASSEACLNSMLSIVERINRDMTDYGYMLTTSIAFGQFRYQDRIEFVGIEKNALLGNGYLAAFLDNEIGKPRLEPGLCRILAQGLPEIDISRTQFADRVRPNGRLHQYFYWMTQSGERIEEFETQYRDSYQLKYTGMLAAIRKSCNEQA